MVEFLLSRKRTGSDGTFGTLTWNNGKTLATLEKPWHGGDNHPDESCILPGKYDLCIDYSPHLEEATPRLLEVPGRSQIRIHNANLQTQLKGCIAVGRGEQDFDGEPGVGQSRLALADLMRAVNTDMDFSTVTINNDFQEAQG